MKLSWADVARLYRYNESPYNYGNNFKGASTNYFERSERCPVQDVHESPVQKSKYVIVFLNSWKL